MKMTCVWWMPDLMSLRLSTQSKSKMACLRFWTKFTVRIKLMIYDTDTRPSRQEIITVMALQSCILMFLLQDAALTWALSCWRNSDSSAWTPASQQTTLPFCPLMVSFGTTVHMKLPQYILSESVFLPPIVVLSDNNHHIFLLVSFQGSVQMHKYSLWSAGKLLVAPWHRQAACSGTFAFHTDMYLTSLFLQLVLYVHFKYVWWN